jgi:uncharacterized protein with HEPN domain
VTGPRQEGPPRFERVVRPPSGTGSEEDRTRRPYDPEQTRRRLGVLAMFAARSAEIVAGGHAAFRTESAWMTRAAATYLIIEVATVCEKLHGRVRDHFSAVPWRRIAGMRNIAAHAYDEVNDEVVWDVLAVFVPQLVRDLGLPARPGDPIVLPPELSTV